MHPEHENATQKAGQPGQHLPDIPSFSNERMEEQVGGGRRAASPPPEQTPTRLRSKVKATERDTGLVRNAGTRRERLLHDLPTISESPIPSPSGEHDEPSQGRQIQCASLLFNGVPSQYLYLTCQPKSSSSLQQTSASPSVDTQRPRRSSEATLSGPAWPPTSTSTEEPKNIVSSHPSPRRRALSALPAGVGLPLPRIPPQPSLVGLKETLAYVMPDGVTPQKPSVTRDSLTTTGAGGVPHDRTEDGTNEQTPRAARPNELPSTFADFELGSDAGFDLQLPERPETPTPSSRSKGAPKLLTAGADETDKAVAGPSALGRTPVRVNSILDESFQDINLLFSQLASRVGLPFQQVINRFMKQYACTCSNNYWNTYQKFHASNKEQELARLGDIDLTALTPSVHTIKNCYKQFQQEYPDTWQNILSTFEAVDHSAEGGKSLAHRQALFLRLSKHYCQVFTGISKAHGFETAFVMAGSVVHQDGGNGAVYVSPGAVNFWLERCRADDNEILAHFKAHIYNRGSLDNVTLAFDGLPGEALSAAGVGAETSKTITKNTDNGDEAEIIEVGEREDHSLLRSAFVQALTKVGCQWASRKLFPWKGLPSKLASSGVVCHNFPDSVPFPGEDRHRSKGGSKGISDLSLTECSILIAAFNKPSKEGLYFEQKPKGIADPRARRFPVIIGAAPEYDSPHQFGKQMFADGSIDRKGLPRPPNTAATCIKKKKSTVSRSKGKGKAVAPPATSAAWSLSESDDIQEIPALPPLEKRMLPLRKRRPAKCSTVKNGSDIEVQDISSPSGSEFKPEDGDRQQTRRVASTDDEEGEMTSEGAPDSDIAGVPLPRKRKAKAELPARPLKKRVFIEVPVRAPATKDKGKAPAHPFKKSRVPASPALSHDEVEFPTMLSTFKSLQPATANPMCEETSVRERPKPRLVTKETASATQRDIDPFSQRCGLSSLPPGHVTLGEGSGGGFRHNEPVVEASLSSLPPPVPPLSAKGPGGHAVDPLRLQVDATVLPPAQPSKPSLGEHQPAQHAQDNSIRAQEPPSLAPLIMPSLGEHQPAQHAQDAPPVIVPPLGEHQPAQRAQDYSIRTQDAPPPRTLHYAAGCATNDCG
ncbi:hypothetical protein JVT61DRAFT_7058 [Boletus reticuloceps]|uniref:Uncharacterized protein n=1 Tax=Boletus reticuloceps TaxID=495285 RepID=A0A8I2YJX4_9AGAM|nr:hypothetical protein JVT61DRAFT_7058 [Boletus reticuloceps]